MHPLSPAIFKHVFDKYNFSRISNIFDDNKPYAVRPQARIIENVRTKCIIICETLRIRDKKLQQNLPKYVQKVLKWPLHYVNFRKIFGEACPRTPLESFSFSIYFKIIRKEKLRLKYMSKFGAPP